MAKNSDDGDVADMYRTDNLYGRSVLSLAGVAWDVSIELSVSEVWWHSATERALVERRELDLADLVGSTSSLMPGGIERALLGLCIKMLTTG